MSTSNQSKTQTQCDWHNDCSQTEWVQGSAHRTTTKTLNMFWKEEKRERKKSESKNKENMQMIFIYVEQYFMRILFVCKRKKSFASSNWNGIYFICFHDWNDTFLMHIFASLTRTRKCNMAQQKTHTLLACTVCCASQRKCGKSWKDASTYLVLIQPTHFGNTCEFLCFFVTWRFHLSVFPLESFNFIFIFINFYFFFFCLIWFNVFFFIWTYKHEVGAFYKLQKTLECRVLAAFSVHIQTLK